MNKNLLWKWLLIVGVLLVFLFGIFGIPQTFSGQGLLASMTKRIQLGLDLRGGTHLILQVQVTTRSTSIPTMRSKSSKSS